MSQVEQIVAVIRRAADRVGVQELSRLSGVPRSTVRSFAERGWTHNSLVAFDKLARVAARIERGAAQRDARRLQEGGQGEHRPDGDEGSERPEA